MLSFQQREVLPLQKDEQLENCKPKKWHAFYKEKVGSPTRCTPTSNNPRKLPHHRPPPSSSELVSLPSAIRKGPYQTSGQNEQQKRAQKSMKGNDQSSIVLPLNFRRIPSYNKKQRKTTVRILRGAGGNRDGKPGVERSTSSKKVDNSSDAQCRTSLQAKDNIYIPLSRAYGSGQPAERDLPAAGRPFRSFVTTNSSAPRELYKKFESLPSYQSEPLRGGHAQGRRRQPTSGTTALSPTSCAEDKNTFGKNFQTKTSSSSSNSNRVRKSNYSSSTGGGFANYLFPNEGRGGNVGPSHPKESSSESSGESLGISPYNSASQQNNPNPPIDHNDDSSSCSSSRSISLNPLNSRLNEVKLLNSDPPCQEQQEEQGGRPSAATRDLQLNFGSSDSSRKINYSNSFSQIGSSLAGGGMQNYSGISRNRSNNQYSSSSRDVHGLVGLVNEGNTCYLNSCLQCLAHSMPLVTAVQSQVESLVVQRRGSSSRAGPSTRDFSSLAEMLAYAFRQVVRDLWQRQSFTATSAKTFLHCVQAWAPQFAGHSQHDAQEVLRAILDGLHEALNRVTTTPPYRDLYLEPKPEEELAELTWRYHKLCQDSIIQDIFCGQLQSTIECCTCHRKSHCFDPFHDLSLPLPKNERETNMRGTFRGGNSGSRVTLQDCLSAFVTPEQLEGSNKYYCPNCKAPRTSMKKLTLYRLPPILVLHIKRFYKSERYSYQKDDTPVYYPLQGLDFTEFLPTRSRKVRRGGVVYDLYSMCCHMGSLGCGHYTAQCRNCENDICELDSRAWIEKGARILKMLFNQTSFLNRPI